MSEGNQIAELAKVIDEVYTLNAHAHDTFSQVIELCKWTLRRHEPGSEEQYMKVVGYMQAAAVRTAPQAFAILMQHFVMDQQFSDLLGPVYMELAGKWKQSGLGQYFTPWPVCVAMAEMVMVDVEPTQENPLTVNEPCVGSGAMLLAARDVVARRFGRPSLQWLKVSGADIDPLCVNMAEVQLRLTDDQFMMSWAIANAHTLTDLQENK